MDKYIRKVVGVKRIIDGDTVELIVDLGYTITITDKFRMAGYDAPETYRPRIKGEKAAGTKVTDFLAEELGVNSENLYVQTAKTGKYGRYIATIFYLEWEDEDGNKLDSPNVVNVNDLVIKYMQENNLTKEALRAAAKAKT